MFRRTFIKLAAAALIHPALNWTSVRAPDQHEGLTAEKILRAREVLLDELWGVTSAFMVVYSEQVAELARRYLPGVRVIQAEWCDEGRDRAGDPGASRELMGGGTQVRALSVKTPVTPCFVPPF